MSTFKKGRMKREAETVTAMIHLYCEHEHHRPKGELCPECSALLNYTLYRLEHCPFQEGKTTSAHCPVHCYKPDRRLQIRLVMRKAGPMMLFRHPVMSMLIGSTAFAKNLSALCARRKLEKLPALPLIQTEL